MKPRETIALVFLFSVPALAVIISVLVIRARAREKNPPQISPIQLAVAPIALAPSMLFLAYGQEPYLGSALFFAYQFAFALLFWCVLSRRWDVKWLNTAAIFGGSVAGLIALVLASVASFMIVGDF